MASVGTQFKDIETVASYVKSPKVRDALPFKAGLMRVQVVAGGLCNFVYRLSYEDGRTAIFKYYPPYVAAMESTPFAQSRYYVEKCALETLGREKCLVEGANCVWTPRVLFSDDELFVLIMQDCGQNLVTLFEFLKQDYRPPASVLSEDTDEAREAFMRQMIEHFAREIHKYLKTIGNEISIKPRTHQEPFANKPVWELISKYCIDLQASQAKAFGLEKELDYYIKNRRPLEPPPLDESCFVVGDLWPNSILVNVDERVFWTLDWEMARFERPLHDLQQLIANLWVMKQNERLFSVSHIDYLIRRLQYEYFGKETADWRVECGEYAKIGFILWVIELLREKHWEIEDSRSAALQALAEVEAL